MDFIFFVRGVLLHKLFNSFITVDLSMYFSMDCGTREELKRKEKRFRKEMATTVWKQVMIVVHNVLVWMLNISLYISVARMITCFVKNTLSKMSNIWFYKIYRSVAIYFFKNTNLTIIWKIFSTITLSGTCCLCHWLFE